MRDNHSQQLQRLDPLQLNTHYRPECNRLWPILDHNNGFTALAAATIIAGGCGGGTDDAGGSSTATPAAAAAASTTAPAAPTTEATSAPAGAETSSTAPELAPGSTATPAPTHQDGADDHPSDAYFALERVLDISIEIAGEDWDTLRHQTRTLEDVIAEIEEFGLSRPFADIYTWFPATVTVDGESHAGVGVRKKGFAEPSRARQRTPPSRGGTAQRL